MTAANVEPRDTSSQKLLARGPRGAWETRVRALCWQERDRFVAMAAQGLVLLGLANLAPLLLRGTIDAALPAHAPDTLLVLTAASCVTALHHSLFGWLRKRSEAELEAVLEHRVREELLERVLRLPFAYVSTRDVGELSQVLECGVRAALWVPSMAMGMWIDVLFAVVEIALLIAYAPSMLWIALLAVAALSAVGIVSAERQRVLSERMISAHALEELHLYEAVAGVPLFRAHAKERFALTRWLSAFAYGRELGSASDRAHLALATGVDVIGQLVSIGVLALGAHACLRGELSLGTFLAVSAWMQGLLASTGGLLSLIVSYRAAAPDFARVDELIAQASPSVAPAQRGTSHAGSPAIEVSDVSFRYPERDAYVLDRASLRVRPGEYQRLSSPSGSGKTTLLRIIAGLYEPESGSVMVGGVPVRAARDDIAYLPQDPQLFAGSVRQNLELLSRASRERIEAAARRTGLFEWAEKLPMKLETVVAPGGANLSGGERQLVLLTAALASERRVLLLDEALCHVDPIARLRLEDPALYAGRTVLAVSHERVAGRHGTSTPHA